MALVPRVFLTAEQIQNRVREMGAQISADYPEGPLYLISILKGAFIFMADLSRVIKTPSRIEFMGISSYGRGKTSSGEVKVTKDLDVSIEGHHVLIVEDIVDSGVTLTYLMTQSAGAAASKITCDRHLAGQTGETPASGSRSLRRLPDPRRVCSWIRAGLRGRLSEFGRYLRAVGGVGTSC